MGYWGKCHCLLPSVAGGSLRSVLETALHFLPNNLGALGNVTIGGEAERIGRSGGGCSGGQYNNRQPLVVTQRYCQINMICHPLLPERPVAFGVKALGQYPIRPEPSACTPSETVTLPPRL